MSASFTKASRLLTKSQFDLVLDNGIKVVCKDFVIVASKVRRSDDTSDRRLGLIVSSKVGDSVRRNHVKRHVRESFRQLNHEGLAGRDFVVIARPNLTAPTKTDQATKGHKRITRKITGDVSKSFEHCFKRLLDSLAKNAVKASGVES